MTAPPDRDHYSYKAYADPAMARSFEDRRFGGPIGELVAQGLEPVVERRQRLGVGHIGHGRLVVEGTFLVDVERRRHVEDGLAVLDGDHPTGGERAAIADAVVAYLLEYERKTAAARDSGAAR